MILPKKLHNDAFLNESEEEFEENDEEPNNILSQNKKKENCESIENIFKICRSFGIKKIFPHMYTALSIAVTLPVSSASPERAFSKLKLIKNRLRSTMNEERLEALMIISCELDVPIDVGTVINMFAFHPIVLHLQNYYFNKTTYNIIIYTYLVILRFLLCAINLYY
jgi:hypothetical protein